MTTSRIDRPYDTQYCRYWRRHRIFIGCSLLVFLTRRPLVPFFFWVARWFSHLLTEKNCWIFQTGIWTWSTLPQFTEKRFFAFLPGSYVDRSRLPSRSVGNGTPPLALVGRSFGITCHEHYSGVGQLWLIIHIGTFSFSFLDLTFLQAWLSLQGHNLPFSQHFGTYLQGCSNRNQTSHLTLKESFQNVW